MKQIAILVGAILISTCSFADMSSTHLISGGSRLNDLSSAWRTHQTVRPSQFQHDINIVYGGADISRKPTLIAHTTTA